MIILHLKNKQLHMHFSKLLTNHHKIKLTHKNVDKIDRHFFLSKLKLYFQFSLLLIFPLKSFSKNTHFFSLELQRHRRCRYRRQYKNTIELQKNNGMCADYTDLYNFMLCIIMQYNKQYKHLKKLYRDSLREKILHRDFTFNFHTDIFYSFFLEEKENPASY